MDDLRREIGLEAVAQRDPKVQYKRRSYEMFADMRRNIQRDIADRFFRQLAAHQDFVRRQQADVQYQLKASDAGYQVVQRDSGRGKKYKLSCAGMRLKSAVMILAPAAVAKQV
jgi:preprotein translocase subunit SecA